MIKFKHVSYLSEDFDKDWRKLFSNPTGMSLHGSG